MSTFKIIKKIVFWEIWKGLLLTLKKFLFAHPVTIEYPEKHITIPAPGFRGRHALVRDPKTGDTLCVACLRCVKVCPCKCIHIEWTWDNENKRRVVTKYEIDALRCVFCAYCVEVCPVNAIVLTEFYEYSNENKKSFLFDKEQLLKNWDEFIEKREKPYLNPFWKPKGIPERFLPIKKRNFKGYG